MKIVIFESGNLASSFRKLGHEVLIINWQPNGGNDENHIRIQKPLYYQDLLSIFEKNSFYPDLVLWHDVGNIPRVWGLEALECPTLGYFIDTYCNPWHIPYSFAFDCTLVAQKNAVSLFSDSRFSKLNKWMPLYCDHDRDYHESESRDIPVCFVGTVDNKQNILRKKFLDQFAKYCPIIVKQGRYRPLFARSKIVLNQSAAGEINFRAFEAAACGAVVLNENCDNGFEELFRPGHDTLRSYIRGDARHAAEIALDALSDEKKLSEIARNGEKLVCEKHSTLARAAEIINIVQTLGESPAKRIAKADFIRQQLAMSCIFIAGESDTLLQPEIVRHFEALGTAYHEQWNKLIGQSILHQKLS